MAIKFQYNKTSLNNLNKQLKVRQNALPTLQNKESALRLEVRKAKEKADKHCRPGCLPEKIRLSCRTLGMNSSRPDFHHRH